VSTWHHASGPPAQRQLSQPSPGTGSSAGAGLPRVSASDSDVMRQQYHYARRHSVPHPNSDLPLSSAPNSLSAVNEASYDRPATAKVLRRSTFMYNFAPRTLPSCGRHATYEIIEIKFDLHHKLHNK